MNVTDHVAASWEVLFRDESRFWIQRVVQPVVLLVGVVGNLITVVVLTRPRMSSSTNTYLTALAVTDLIYLVFLYALSLENHPHNKTAEFYWYWQLWRFLLWIVDSASQYHMPFPLRSLTLGLYVNENIGTEEYRKNYIYCYPTSKEIFVDKVYNYTTDHTVFSYNNLNFSYIPLGSE